jgi:PAS domain S-box-containing protein
MFTEKPYKVLLFCFIVTFTSGVLQYLNPGVNLFDSGLVISIVLTVFLKNDFYTKLFGGLAILLIIVSAWYNHQNLTTQQVVTQHLFSGMIVVLAVLAVLYIKKLYRSIESDERQVNALFEHATEGIVLTDSKGKIVLINPAAASLFHYQKEELLGKTIETLIPGRFHSSHLHYRDIFYKHPSNRTMGHGRDLYARTKGGGEFPVEVSLSFYNQNDKSYVIAFVVDITARKKAEQDLLNQKRQLERITEEMKKLNAELENKVEQRTLILREALQELEKSQGELSEALNKEKELNEIKSRFVSMASHEFRTPLSTVLSSASLISKYTQTEEQDKRDKHILRIKAAVKHLNILLEDFLSLGKLEEGRVILEITSFRIKDLIEEVLDEFRLTTKNGQEIDTQYEGRDFFISDKRLLRNIIINLVSNAIKFSPETGSIWLHLKINADHLEFMVKDKGVGISEEDQQHLFSSFFRAKNVVNIEGTGLGLHIVKRYVEMLAGEIHVKSKLHEGTTIIVKLPQQTEPLFS